jgi:uncharacterized repeat protein (TIGR03803 family)
MRFSILILIVAVFGLGSLSRANAQTFQVLNNFTGGQDGSGPVGGLTIDRSGNLYGTASAGGYQDPGCNDGSWGFTGCGSVFELNRHGSNWIFKPLYDFQGGYDSGNPGQGVVIGPDGALYGVTNGVGGCNNYNICGNVFRLQPPPTFCATATCLWRETVLHQFSGQPDGSLPTSRVLFDSAGNMYGATVYGGAYNRGAAYELSPGDGGWTESVIYSFDSVGLPAGDVAIDPANNLYGAAYDNNFECCYGAVFQLQPSQSGWSLNHLYQFNGNDGYAPIGVFRDPSGNIFGVSTGDGGNESANIYELSPSNGGWNYSLVYNFQVGYTDASGLVMDSAGNLYGCNSELGDGYIFKLTPSGSGWIFTTLHTFSGSDGAGATGQIVIDSNGNLYGSTVRGGTYGYGVVWEITP